MKTETIIKNSVSAWLEGAYDEDTKEEIKNLQQNNPTELTDAFYKNLEFGTGGLRGIMGAGTNRMNRYTVGMATQGLANYLHMMFTPPISIAIAYDSRNNSPEFARIAAEVLSANDIQVYLFESLRPTPELSFSIRELKCQSGIVITASHNPKEYNGYKVYWEDGGQLVPPHDKNVITEVNKINTLEAVKWTGNENLITMIGEAMDKKYIERICSLTLSPQVIKKQHDLKIVYTPIHGTGVKLVPRALHAFGFNNIIHVPEQDITDGNFPTVKSPNPEESAALDMALKKAAKTDADIVMATDPDSDRVGIAVKNAQGKFALLNGNQAASILIYYLLEQWKQKGLLTPNNYIVKTIVTSELLRTIADSHQVPCYDVLTGFKYIAEAIKTREGQQQFIGGGEESYGYLVGDFVRDKDAVISCCMLAEATAWAKDQGKTLFDLLLEIYLQYGFYKESLHSVVKKGKEGSEAIQTMMENFRKTPPATILGSRVVRIADYLHGTDKDVLSGEVSLIELPKSNVLQFFTEDGSKATVRPSGTEPKIKFYFGVREALKTPQEFDSLNKVLQDKLDNIARELIQ